MSPETWGAMAKIKPPGVLFISYIQKKTQDTTRVQDGSGRSKKMKIYGNWQLPIEQKHNVEGSIKVEVDLNQLQCKVHIDIWNKQNFHKQYSSISK